MAAQPALSQQEMTDAASTPHTMTRRSSRVRARFPILIASLSPATPFSLLCETLIVNAHGCATKVPQPLEIGTPVRLRIVPAPARRGDSLPRENSREVTGRIVLCQPIAGTQTSWVAGIELDTPGNFWGLSPAPEDWKRWEEPARGIKPDAPAGRPAVELKMPLWPLAAPAAKAAPPSQADNDELKKQLAAQQEMIVVLENRVAKSLASLPGLVRQQLAEAHQETLAQTRQQLSTMLAESVQEHLPAQTEAMVRLQERLVALESVPETIRQQIADTQQQTQIAVREQLDAALAPLRPLQQEVAALRKSGQDAAQVRAAVAEQFEQLPWQIQQHAQAAFQGLQELARTELQRIITEFRSHDGQEAARRQAALEASAQALQKELTQAREALESTVQGVPQRVQEPITAAVQQALGQASAEISGQVARELEALQERGRTLLEDLRGSTEVLRAEREATGAQLEAAAAQRDELQRWLAEQRTAFTQLLDRHRQQLAEYQDASSNEVRQKLEQFATELAGRAAATLEEQIKSDIENQAQSAEADFEQRLGPMLGRASALREEILFLLDSLQKESARCQTQVNAMLEEKDSVDDWRRERTAEFQKLFEEALLETTGQIRGRLQLAQEMITEPMEKLRDQTLQQLQEQAAQQARQLREDTDELTERLRALRRDLESSLREALRAQAGETAAAFGQEIAQTAQECVQEWRSALASNLESISS
ncbi:MAG TPA: hypothetical protein VEC95_05840, partial [Terriglobales bacterium]|nr:hypothetical protein [Terriglobales bacterium]